MHSSETAASKLGEAKSSTRLSGVTAKRSICPVARLAMPRWETATPLGRPVEPEVWMT